MYFYWWCWHESYPWVCALSRNVFFKCASLPMHSVPIRVIGKSALERAKFLQSEGVYHFSNYSFSVPWAFYCLLGVECGSILLKIWKTTFGPWYNTIPSTLLVTLQSVVTFLSPNLVLHKSIPVLSKFSILLGPKYRSVNRGIWLANFYEIKSGKRNGPLLLHLSLKHLLCGMEMMWLDHHRFPLYIWNFHFCNAFSNSHHPC